MNPHRTSAEALEDHIPGELLKEHKAQSSEDVFVQLLSRPHKQDSLLIPAVPEPMVVWILSGEALVQERPLGGEWLSSEVKAGDFFLTTATEPTELRWEAKGSQPFRVMHIYIGLQLMKKAVKELHGKSLADFTLREVSGESDGVLSGLLNYLYRELNDQKQSSTLTVQGLAQALTVHIVRTYEKAGQATSIYRGGLPAFKLHRIFDDMKNNLSEPFSLSRLAEIADLSEYHFSRVFKQATGLSPLRYFIRLRVDHAKRLLNESRLTIVDIGMSIGYSSPSHFAQVFRKETGLAPGEYRGRGIS